MKNKFEAQLGHSRQVLRAQVLYKGKRGHLRPGVQLSQNGTCPETQLQSDPKNGILPAL